MNERYRTAANSPYSLSVLSWLSAAPKPVRAAVYLAAGAAVAIPLAACQPQPAAPGNPSAARLRPAGTSASATTAATTQDTAAGTPAGAGPVREIIVEKPVYIDRPATPRDEVLATVNGKDITFAQIRGPLVEGYGLNILFKVMQLEVAKTNASQRGLAVNSADIKAESDMTLAKAFPDADPVEYPKYLDGLLQQQRATVAEYNLAMETNAYLRKIAHSFLKEPPNEEQLREAFNVFYGETVKARHIEVNNLQEIAEAQKQLAAGIDFAVVAQTMSKNRLTAPLGGELPVFSRATKDFNQGFVDTAFALKEGEVSDPVNASGKFHLIKLDRRIAPKAVKFEDVKDTLSKRLVTSTEDAAIKQFRDTLGDQVRAALEIKEPTLKRQWDQAVREAEKNKPPSGR